MNPTQSSDQENQQTFHATVKDTLDRYLAFFPDEQQRQQVLLDTLADPTLDLRLRSTIPEGHLCASGIILLPDNKVLMLEHKALGIWVVPGGHYDITDGTLAAAAIRETLEETGLEGVKLHPWHLENGIPLDIDTHPIPARPEKGEGPHQHFDFRYILQVENPAEVTEKLSLQAAEITAFRAFGVDEIDPASSIAPAIKKLSIVTG